jgi:transposase
LNYSDTMKARMISRMTGPNAMSATALSRDVGIAQCTLSRWLREASIMGGMSKSKKDPIPQSPRDWPLERKLRVVLESLSLSDQELGAFLRREGLHEAQLQEMRSSVEEAFSDQKKKKRSKKVSSEKKAIKKLEKELARKDKALAEVTALLVLKKKLESYYAGLEEEDTSGKSGK